MIIIFYAKTEINAPEIVPILCFKTILKNKLIKYLI